MSEIESRSRSTAYPAAINERLGAIDAKVDTLVKYWSESDQMTTLLTDCRTCITEASRLIADEAMTVRQQLDLLLATPVGAPPEGQAPQRRWHRWTRLTGLVAVIGLACGLGMLVHWGLGTDRRLPRFVSTLDQTLGSMREQITPEGRARVQAVYQQHGYAAPREWTQAPETPKGKR